MKISWSEYDPGGAWDELLSGPGRPRPHARRLTRHLAALTAKQLGLRQAAAERAIVEMGITFTVYSEGQNIDRAWPFDIIPRVIAASEWRGIEAGLKQRLTALNLFIDDIYNEQRILADGRFPRELIETSSNFLRECSGFRPAHGVWAHVCGSDLVRDADGTVYVLEDNLRVPSGVSYMLENRIVTKQVFPELFAHQRILPVDDYPSQLFDTLASLSPRPLDYPEVVVLTPGIYNSAYFEHAYLAQAMGAELVEGGDLVVAEDDCVYMRTIAGLERVDVIYRRVNDTFLDPEVFRPDSMLGVPGLMRAWRAGNVAIANAPGAGVADDKLVYAFVPDIIRYYLDEEPILPNVPTHACVRPDECRYVLEHMEELVVKPVNESGGYGMLIGPAASRQEIEKFRRLVKRKPRNYVAQPVLQLSTAPTLVKNRLEPRHLDLRPFSLQGDRSAVTAGGLTRVALVKGSLVVNSSQGGGSKDTWVVEDGEA
ncbi:circularly permuted type 2 ATP-grasp protein [Thioalkalivibrio sp. XN8]|uniref:circularly permuted type 2 ATP-grasp protein n=1 Tax=Thioalkalivibrio sp. XN8 TaxID=2712863 RepID=UPI0013EDDAC4|nr:circularly permuted type 2 ATP-grasp protein [Thioalkalivibrio sp. XN8]NGP54001.1 circularly permuted type 2 ATP-grasp protein [Thioalkalivibrio sp. XN8]